MKKISRILFILIGTFSNKLEAQKTFSELDSLLNYSNLKSTSVQSAQIRLNQAKKAKLAAIYGVLDPNSSASFSYTDNTKLPVNLFPAEIFGGQPGTYQEVQSGIRYVSNGNIYADVKLLNIQGWEDAKLSKLNVDATKSDNAISLKHLYENIAATYYNIANLQEQLKTSKQNALSADTLLQIAENKFNLGLVKQQDVNDTKVNYLNSKESIKQIQLLIFQNYTSLKILCDIQTKDSIIINPSFDEMKSLETTSIQYSNLNFNNSVLKEKLARSSYRKSIYSQFPTISLFYSNTSQQFNTESKLFDNNVKWIPSNYIGLKVNVPLPLISAHSVSQISKAKYDYLLAKTNTEHIKIKSDLEFKQLGTEFEKAKSQSETNKEVLALRKDTYQKNLNLYIQGLIGIDAVLNSFNAMVNSNYSFITSTINVLYAKSKININNNIK